MCQKKKRTMEMKFAKENKWNLFKKMKSVLNEKPILVIYTTKSNFDTKYPNNTFHTNHFYHKGIQT